MAVNSVTSSNYVSQVQPQPQPNAERVGEKENDGDRDDGSKAAAVQNAPKPTVNTQGQTIGSVINVKA
jgi:hypothetical protein